MSQKLTLKQKSIIWNWKIMYKNIKNASSKLYHIKLLLLVTVGNFRKNYVIVRL